MPNALSPRRMTHSLSALGMLADQPSSPSATLSATLWQGAQDLANAALESHFIQGIKDGTLNPNYYGQYTVQDVVYCHHGVEDWQAVATRATHPDMKSFAEARVKSWVDYAQSLFDEWHIGDPSAITLSSAVRDYASFESDVARNFEPHYAVVVMLPCDRLWYWLATQIRPDAADPNSYAFWIKENGASDAGAKRLERFIDTHTDLIDESIALDIYCRAMLGEVNGFRSAGKQDLLDLSDFYE
ncbi:MAG: TenA family transcriptional regulator [Chloroflexota bacterium]